MRFAPSECHSEAIFYAVDIMQRQPAELFRRSLLAWLGNIVPHWGKERELWSGCDNQSNELRFGAVFRPTVDQDIYADPTANTALRRS